MEKLRKLTGTEDQVDRSWAEIRRLQDCLRKLFDSHGYRTIETPVLEPTELFVRKGGGELANLLYSFTDPGGNSVSLRPEYTSSIIRWFLEGDGRAEPPVRAQYSGPVFRYAERGDGLRQFNQSGVELIGADDAGTDAEVVGLAAKGMTEMGVSQGEILLADLGLYIHVLERLGLSERARMFVLRHVSQLGQGAEGLEEVRQRARAFHLLAGESEAPELGADIAGMGDEGALALIAGLLRREEPGSFGQRGVEEVAERLLRKLRGTESAGLMERALEFGCQLALVRGEAGPSLEAARRVLEGGGMDASALERLESVVGLVGDSVPLKIDFGLARGISYYSGIVFEMVDASTDVSLGGGGRYDGLARSLGSGGDVPALGFAFNMERVAEVTRVTGRREGAAADG